ncbi:hypothetical protein CXG81DRAFT_25047 [Caulochytrium protostelioides]|uniref:40S ribosomal protein S6 n=1 Tax=Caulochytrium protostelioides TaxID=1555241 RepID=A0A4P9XA78_9FUNG|nr:hypothetical protein CXG81DRAFT_25047 [Caulochytrium protostelioides]|eukprot:RKP02268.1 hypothetical protein CXG81DRAFT_25047 [Caulochytrium protostelioides]
MKLNISCPSTGANKSFEIEDERRLRIFYDQRMAAEVKADALGDEFAGYVLKITGGNDKQGFPMKQGVLYNHRVRLLLSEGSSCYRPRRDGERKRKSVRGCIVTADMSALSLSVVRAGPAPIAGLTDVTVPKALPPKRASKIRALFNLTKADDVRDYVIGRKVTKKNGSVVVKKPKVQRLITPKRLARKRARLAEKTARRTLSKVKAKAYRTLVDQRLKEKKAARVQLAKKRAATKA